MMSFINNLLTSDIFDFGKTIFANGLLLSLFYILAVYVFSNIVSKALCKALDKMAMKYGRHEDMLFILIKKIIKAVTLAIVVVIALYEIVPFRSLGNAVLGLSGILTVALTLGAQDIASNFVSGFVLSVYEPFKKGDLIYIKEKDITGIIEDMNFRHCIIRTYDNTKVIVPNNTLNNAIVENRGSANSEPYNNLYYIDIDYRSDYQLAIRMLKEFLVSSDIVVRKKDVAVSVGELKDSSISIKIRVYTKSPDEGFVLKGQLNEFVLDKLRKAGIEIPYPHLSVEVNK